MPSLWESLSHGELSRWPRNGGSWLIAGTYPRPARRYAGRNGNTALSITRTTSTRSSRCKRCANFDVSRCRARSHCRRTDGRISRFPTPTSSVRELAHFVATSDEADEVPGRPALGTHDTDDVTSTGADIRRASITPQGLVSEADRQRNRRIASDLCRCRSGLGGTVPQSVSAERRRAEGDGAVPVHVGGCSQV